MPYVSLTLTAAFAFAVAFRGETTLTQFLCRQVRHIADDPPCRCPSKFCVERQSQGRYRVGEKMLFIRVS